MPSKADEYVQLTRKNRKRLLTVIILVLVVIAVAFWQLKPTGLFNNAGKTKAAMPLITIADTDSTPVTAEIYPVTEPVAGINNEPPPGTPADKHQTEITAPVYPEEPPVSPAAPVARAAAKALRAPQSADLLREARKNPAPRPAIVTVQVASFADPIEAQAMRARLKRAGFPSRVERYSGSGKIYYRVRVGVFTNRQDADIMLLNLRHFGFNGKIAR